MFFACRAAVQQITNGKYPIDFPIRAIPGAAHDCTPSFARPAVLAMFHRGRWGNLSKTRLSGGHTNNYVPNCQDQLRLCLGQMGWKHVCYDCSEGYFRVSAATCR